jgi:bifunctional UDP-N-acetylglucosamine pyrophosphorylase/glucosamine-1-phosphate N-acetyltransferase
MRSAIAKPLHRLAGRSLLGHVMAAASALQPQRLVVVVRHQAAAVAEHARSLYPGVLIAYQDEIPGTGRAVQCALAALAADQPTGGGSIVVLPGDCPLITADVLQQLLAAHQSAAVTVLTATVADPTGYGRIVRDPQTGQLVRIVEQRDATIDVLAINEINSSVYAFAAQTLTEHLGQLDQNNDQGEVLLTDVIGQARQVGALCQALTTADPLLIEGVNDRVQLARLGAELNRRIVTAAMRNGVSVVDPATTWIDATVTIAEDVIIKPGTCLEGNTRIDREAIIGPDTTLRDCQVGQAAVVERVHGVQSQIGAAATVGPWTHLRPGTVLGRGAKAGSFVEIKASQVGEGAKVPHLSYVGDATIGEGSNIGAATIFANYDGQTKQRTVVGRQVRIGSDTVLVAPVKIGDGAYTGAGAVVRRDVPPGALAVSDAHQRNIDHWAQRRRPNSAAAQAANLAACIPSQKSPAEFPPASGRPEPSDNATDPATSGDTPTQQKGI